MPERDIKRSVSEKHPPLTRMEKGMSDNKDEFCLSPVKIFSELTGLCEDEIKYIFERTKELKSQNKTTDEIKKILKKECTEKV